MESDGESTLLQVEYLFHTVEQMQWGGVGRLSCLRRRFFNGFICSIVAVSPIITAFRVRPGCRSIRESADKLR
jgi:hypothetical protein